VKQSDPTARAAASPTAACGSDAVPGTEFLARAIEAAGLGILALGRANGDLRYVNEAGAAILRGATDSLRNETWDLVRRTFLAESEGKPKGAQLSARSLPLGASRIGYTIYPEEEEIWVFFRDVSEKEHLSSVAEALRLSDALLSVFTTLRHDLGNSVNVAKTSLEVLRRGKGRYDDEAVRRYVDRALEALGRITDLLAALRDFSSTKAPTLRPVPVAEVVESVVLDRGADLAASGTSLDVEVEARSVSAFADPSSLEDALCELVDRAARCAPGGGSRGVVVRVEARKETVVLRVEPRGTPVPETVPDEGDLGLLVVRRRVSQMEGTVESGDGAATITLRRARGR
jgi:signal transduction histidine kinase